MCQYFVLGIMNGCITVPRWYCSCGSFVLFMYCVCHAFGAGKMLNSWFSFVVLNCVFVTFPCGILGQVWNSIVSIPDLCSLSYFIR